MIGDIYNADKKPILALTAYKEALRACSSNIVDIYLKLIGILIFELSEWKEAKKYFSELEKMSFINIHENWQFCRYGFLIAKNDKNWISALYYGEKMVHKKPKNLKWKNDYEAVLKLVNASKLFYCE